MRTLSYNPKSGLVRVQVTSPNDLWMLESVITAGSQVCSETTRTTRSPDGEERGKRIHTRLTISVEKTAFEPFTASLRVSGKVVDDPDELGILGSYHTLVIETGSVLDIHKQTWTKMELEELNHERFEYVVTIISIDYNEVAVGKLWDYGLETVASWETAIPGKADPRHEEKVAKVLEKLAAEIGKYATAGDAVVFSGPGFFKQRVAIEVKKLLQSRGYTMNYTMIDTSYGGVAGLKETVGKALEAGFIERMGIVYEDKLMTQLLKELAMSPGRVAVGADSVKRAAENGAVDTLIVSSRALKDDYAEMSPIIKETESRGGLVKIISEHHEKGAQLIGLGGVAALLRYNVTP